MANKNLTTNYLSRLSNANHDGVSQQICDRLRDFETENQMLIQAGSVDANGINDELINEEVEEGFSPELGVIDVLDAFGK